MSQTSETAEAGSSPFDVRPWRCRCGYMNASTERCVICHAEMPPQALATPDRVATQTELRQLWEQAQVDRVARLAVGPPAITPQSVPVPPTIPPSATFDDNAPYPPPPYPPPPPPRGAAGSTQRVVARGLQVVLAVVVCCLTVAGVAAWWLMRDTASWPARWDPRVASIAAFDEQHRGLHFRHPVPVLFLSDAAFRQKVVGPAAATTAKDRADAQQVVEELRALGLASGSPDLLSGGRNLVGSDVEGLYDFKTKTVWVRGDVMTPHLSVVLAHELTHVLQDQNFGVLHPKGDDADTAYTAVIEADAVRMQNLYLKSLSAADQQSYDKAETAVGAQAGTAASSVPAALVEGQQFPYVIGPHFIDVVTAVKGSSGVDDALRTPPTSTLQIIEPSRYLAGDQAVGVAPPSLGAGEQAAGPPSTAGAFELFEVLADRIDAGQAWQAASTWAGDSSILYKSNGRTCLRLDVAVVSDPQPLQSALGAWAAAAHHGTVSRVNGDVRLDTCDPGPNAPAPPQPAIGPLDTLSIRGELATGIATSTKLQPQGVDCVTDVVLAVAGNQGLQQIVDLANNGDTAGLSQFSLALGVRARSPIHAKCPSVTQ